MGFRSPWTTDGRFFSEFVRSLIKISCWCPICEFGFKMVQCTCTRPLASPFSFKCFSSRGDLLFVHFSQVGWKSCKTPQEWRYTSGDEFHKELGLILTANSIVADKSSVTSQYKWWYWQFVYHLVIYLYYSLICSSFKNVKAKQNIFNQKQSKAWGWLKCKQDHYI